MVISLSEREDVDLEILASCDINEFYLALAGSMDTVGHQIYHPDLAGVGPWGRNGWGLEDWAALTTLNVGVRRTTVVSRNHGWYSEGRALLEVREVSDRCKKKPTEP